MSEDLIDRYNFFDTLAHVIESGVSLVDSYEQAEDHANGVKLMLADLGMEMGLSEFEIILLAGAGRLHDIAKTRFDERLFNCAFESLYDFEKEQIFSHPSDSADLVKRTVDINPQLADIFYPDFEKTFGIIAYHHWRYDMSDKSYPCREKIPEWVPNAVPREAGLIKMVDYLDANITDKRGYRRSSRIMVNTLKDSYRVVNAGTVLEDIESRLGTEFDPDVFPYLKKVVEKNRQDSLYARQRKTRMMRQGSLFPSLKD